MTLQDIFDKSAVHLLTQNQRAKKHGTCAYRGDEGLKCAVGCLIPDEHYDSVIEGCGMGGVIDPITGDTPSRKFRDVLQASGVDTGDAKSLALLDSLQIVHDMQLPHSWLSDLKSLAEKFSLSTDALAAFQT